MSGDRCLNCNAPIESSDASWMHVRDGQRYRRCHEYVPPSVVGVLPVEDDEQRLGWRTV